MADGFKSYVPEFLRSKETPDKAVPEAARNIMLALWNDVGVREHLRDSAYMERKDKEEWDKRAEKQLDTLNDQLRDAKVAPDKIYAWIKYQREIDQKDFNNKHRNLAHRFWITSIDGAAHIEINHFYSLYPQLERALMLRSSEETYGMQGADRIADAIINDINEKIERLEPRPVPGELERWVQTTGASKYYEVRNGRIERKLRKGEK